MKTLYLHIGTIKTGTKAIQCFCWENLAVLQKYGYTYPDLSALCPECTQVKNAHFLIDNIENNDKSLHAHKQSFVMQTKWEQPTQRPRRDAHHDPRKQYYSQSILSS